MTGKTTGRYAGLLGMGIALSGALVLGAPIVSQIPVEASGQGVAIAEAETVEQQEAPAAMRLGGKAAEGSEAIGLGYRTWSWPVEPHLVQLDDGSLMRVEALDKKLLVEKYDVSGQLTSSKSIAYELPRYGGFFAGKDAYFLVVGKNNLSQSNDAEVMRVIKYDKSWKRVASCSVKGNNTWKPFEAGSLRMTETGGTLYIHTCHEMYKSSDGYHHQANMTFQVDESAMKVIDGYTGIMNLEYGYVSHSFDQYIQTDGRYVYRVDHGDAYPRGIACTAFRVGSRVTDLAFYGTALDFDGEIGDNYTGANLGGFELAAQQGLFVGSYKAGENAYGEVRNAFVQTVPLGGTNGTVHSLGRQFTKFKASSPVSAGTPKLVKLSSDSFLVMWNEVNEKTDARVLKIEKIDGDGKQIGDIVSCKADISDCQPIVLKDGKVAWYVSDETSPVLYTLDPNRLQEFASQAVAASKVPVSEVTKNGAKYQLLVNGTAVLSKATANDATKLTVPASIKANGKSYQVVSLADRCFEGQVKLNTIVVKTTGLSKGGVKNSLVGSQVKNIKVSVGSKKKNKSCVKKYKKIFTKANVGRAVKVS